MRFVAGLCALVLMAGCTGDETSESSIEREVPRGTAAEVEETLDTVDDPQSANQRKTVFQWGDDLGAWVTEAEMSAVLDDVVKAYAGVGLAGGARVVDGVDWSWTFRPSGRAGEWSVHVHNGEHGGRTTLASLTETDERLPQGAVYVTEPGFAHLRYVFSGPNSDELMCMALALPGIDYEDPDDLAVHREGVLAVASMLLSEMGWVGTE